jgi:predicted nucleotidyltransferase
MIETSQIDLINSVLIEYYPERIALFGSRARGDGNEKSDLDIMITFKNEGKSPYSLLELLSIEDRLATELGFPVEIVNEKSIKNDTLKQRIFSDLMIIYPR